LTNDRRLGSHEGLDVLPKRAGRVLEMSHRVAARRIPPGFTGDAQVVIHDHLTTQEARLDRHASCGLEGVRQIDETLVSRERRE
jgi:hypothetical protein